MAKEDVRIAFLAATTMVMLLLFARLPIVNAKDHRPAAAAEVKIGNSTFMPETLNVVVGTTVTWTNQDNIPHRLVSTNGLFKSKVRDTNEQFAFTFDKPGTYSYYCSIHPQMTGKVGVQ